MTDRTALQRQGRAARETGRRWELEWIHDWYAATKIKMLRELREDRSANIGDVEPHPRVPLGFQARKRKDVVVVSAIEDAEAGIKSSSAPNRSPVAVLQRRLGGGRPNLRGIGMWQDDWEEMLTTFEAAPPMPAIVVQQRDGKRPNPWRALKDAQNLAGRLGVPNVVAVGLALPDLGRPYVLIDYAGYLHVCGELYSRRLW